MSESPLVLGDRLEPLARLPTWVSRAVDGALVAAALQEVTLPVTPNTVVACTSDHRLLKKGGWEVRYLVTVAGDDGNMNSHVLAGRLTAPSPDRAVVDGRPWVDGWGCRLPALGLELHAEPPHQGLTVLPQLLDASSARSVLESVVNSATGAAATLRVHACEPHVVRYQPGSRCTIVYEVDSTWSDGRPAPAMLIVKTYHSDKGRTAYEAMQALMASSLGSSHAVRIAEPLGYSDELRILVQGPVREETTTKNVVVEAISGRARTWEHVSELMDRTAAGLAALHGSGVRPARHTSWETAFAEAIRVPEMLEPYVPATAELARQILDLLEARARACSVDAEVPSHGSFRPAQVLVWGDEISFIDFDNFCGAEPATDVALFCASLKVAGMTAAASTVQSAAEFAASQDALEAISARFTSGYSALRPVSAERVALWEVLDLVTQVLHGWTKVKQSRLDGCVPLLEAHLTGLGLMPPAK